jgi:hypothetical protein
MKEESNDFGLIKKKGIKKLSYWSFTWIKMVDFWLVVDMVE